MSESPDFDAQDGAEAFDEAMLDDIDGMNGMRTFEEAPDVLDVTRARGDRDDDEALALDADEFDPDAIDDADLEDDDELSYRAVTAEEEDDLDGLGSGDGFNEDALEAGGVDGLDEVRDAGSVEGGEDDITDFQARRLSDDDLKEMGYAIDEEGEARAAPASNQAAGPSRT